MTKYNVIIVGAGAAGSFLAYKLRNQGISVLILDKETFPRYKICAGGLSKKTYDILLSENINIDSIVEKRVKKGLFVRNEKFTIRASEENLIYMIYRSEFDNFLLKIAVDNKSVQFRDDITLININQNDNTIIYNYKNKKQKVGYDILVGAWGINKRLNKFVDLIPFERFAVSSSWEGPAGPRYSKYSNEHVVCQIMKGYPGIVGYIFPKSKKITAGLFTSSNTPNKLKKMWNEFMDFWKLDKKIKPNYALIPIRNFDKPIARNNILLVGDTAGLADPFTGEGVYYAFISSRIASKHILNFFKSKNYDLALEYNKDIYSNLFDIQKWGKLYESIFQHLPNISFWFGSECFVGNEILNSFITGEIKYNEISKIIKYTFNRFLG